MRGIERFEAVIILRHQYQCQTNEENHGDVRSIVMEHHLDLPGTISLTLGANLQDDITRAA